MFPVYLNEKGHDGESFDDFNREFEAICKLHHEKNRALAFAIILYDFENPEIAKVLRDQDYWNALNQISGKFLTVFSFHMDAKHAPLIHPILQHNTAENDTFDATKRFVKERFGFDGRMPSILFFQISNKSVTDSYLVTLRAKTVEDAFYEIKNSISASVDAISQVQPEFRGNKAEIFSLIATRLKEREAVFKITRTVKMTGSILEVIGKLAGIAKLADSLFH